MTPMERRTPSGSAPDVEPGDPGLAAVGPDQGGEDADHGGLAGAVGSEQGIHGAGGHGEVEAAQDLVVAVRLGDPDDLDGGGVTVHATSVGG